MEKIVYNNGRNITVLIPKSGQTSIADELVDAKNPTIIVHALEPEFLVSIIFPGESSNEMTREKVCISSRPFVVYHGGDIDLTSWFDDLKHLPELIETNRRIAELEKGTIAPEAEAEAEASRAAAEYFNHIIGHMSSDQEYRPPFSCQKCKHTLDIDFADDGGLNFQDYDIKGRKFFECPSCKQPVSKEVFIRSMRDALLDMAAELDRDLEFIRGESAGRGSDSPVDSDTKIDYVRAINGCLASEYLLKIENGNDSQEIKVNTEDNYSEHKDGENSQSPKRKSRDDEPDNKPKKMRQDLIILD